MKMPIWNIEFTIISIFLLTTFPDSFLVIDVAYA